MIKPLNIFYEEPDPDRWFRFDRYPRKIVRRIIRGKEKISGVAMVAINLMNGLDKLGVQYRFNDYKYIKNHPEEIACIVGKPETFFEKKWPNPVIFGSGIYSHPLYCADLFKIYPKVKCFLVPGEWMRNMFEPYYGDRVLAWPTGIDTTRWSREVADGVKKFDFLIYDKVRWEHGKYEKELINPIEKILKKNNLTYQFIVYGKYRPNGLAAKIKNSKAVIFLCEHETQGFAYQQILATGTPILAWDRGGYWQDPEYYPERVKYGPVSSVPYWDERCGIKFTGAHDFEENLKQFLSKKNSFKARDYILQNLTLEKCAEDYLSIYKTISDQIK